jgi:NRAMP (natural resistance-associated macrophage protein)-like metal ion transporter
LARKKRLGHRKRNPATEVTASKSTTVSAASEKADQPKGDSLIRKVLKILGPGLVTGAADDDPSGIATYSSVGAQYGYSMLWTMIFIYPFMAGIQEISARLGRITGRGIAGNLRRFYPRWALYSVVGLLLLANVFNIGADIGAMGAAVSLLASRMALTHFD